MPQTPTIAQKPSTAHRERGRARFLSAIKVALLLVTLAPTSAIHLSSPVNAQEFDLDGLHNSSKQFAAPSELSWKDWDDPDELAGTWQRALARIPAGPGQSEPATTTDLAQQTQVTQKLPTIIYLHGCSGFWSGTENRIRFLADHGFLVIAPVSLARKTYPRSCNIETREGGLFRGTNGLRRNDAGNAIEMARRLPMVDPDNIVLMGFSEGGLIAVTFEPANEQQQLRARIAEGWTCHTPWPEDRGIKAHNSEPVLTLLAAQDPWHQNQWTKGNCAPFLDTANGSRSIIYHDAPLARQHGLLEFDRPQRDVLDFLKRHVTQ